MPKQRVYELAKELGLNKQELVTKINTLELGFSVGNFMTVLSPEEVKAVKKAVSSNGEVKAKPEAKKAEKVVPKAEEVAKPTMIRRRRKKVEEPEEEKEDLLGLAPSLMTRRKAVVEEEEPEEAPAAVEAEEPLVGDEPEEEVSEESPPEEAAAVEEAPPAQEETPVEAVEEEAPEEPVSASDETAPEVSTTEEVEVAAEKEDEEVEPEEAAAPVQEVPEQAKGPEAPTEEKAAETPVAETTTEPPKEGAVAAKPAGPPRPAPRTKRAAGGARVVGHISENVLKERLASEDKDFSPGPSKRNRKSETTTDSTSRRRTGRTKRVVEGSELYDSRSRRGRRRGGSRGKQKQKRQQTTEITQAAEHKRVIRIEDVISVGDLAHQMGIKAGQVAMKLLESGMMATVNTTLDFETAALIADEFEYSVENVAFDISNFYDTAPDAPEDQSSRPPVVTVMGHVDHGKTSLLDAVRTSTVTEGEAGGITQHIGAYMVETDAGVITFLDTPGHEAFTALRMRGAKATDIVILVVAADDGVMPQTVEAINHSRDAGVPIIVAINKIDKPGANPDRVKTALSEYELIPEEWGGKTLFVEVSAKERINIEGLLEVITLQAELEELRANPDRNAQGIVIEAELDIGRGPVATILVQRGTLRQGDIIVSGKFYGRVRTMTNDRGGQIAEARPSQPIEITGLSGIPEAGEPIFVVEEEKDAKRITEHVTAQRRKETMASRAKEAAGSLEDLSAMIREGKMKELKVIIKGDVQGSVEALREAFGKLGNDEVRTKIIHIGVGGITENDVNLAASSEAGAVIVGFNVRPDPRASEVAEKYGVQIIGHSIIYDAIEQIRSILEGLLSPIIEEDVIGHAEVRDIFSAPKVGTIAGCYVTDGQIRRNAKARVVRQGRVVYSSTIATLRRFKDDVKEVKSGFECGLSVENYNDIKLGDVIEVYELREVSATFD